MQQGGMVHLQMPVFETPEERVRSYDACLLGLRFLDIWLVGQIGLGLMSYVNRQWFGPVPIAIVLSCCLFGLGGYGILLLTVPRNWSVLCGPSFRLRCVLRWMIVAMCLFALLTVLRRGSDVRSLAMILHRAASIGGVLLFAMAIGRVASTRREERLLRLHALYALPTLLVVTSGYCFTAFWVAGVGSERQVLADTLVMTAEAARPFLMLIAAVLARLLVADLRRVMVQDRRTIRLAAPHGFECIVVGDLAVPKSETGKRDCAKHLREEDVNELNH
jgi:hypothetical protein